MKYCALILALAWIIPNSLSSTEQTFPSIADLVQTIIKSDWKMLDHSDIESNKTIEQKQNRIFQKFKQVSEILRQLEEPISAISYDVFYDIALLVAKKIDTEYDLLKLYSSKEKIGNSTTMIDFAKTAVSHQSSSIKELIKKIHKLIVPTPSKRSGDGILKVLADNKDVFDEIIRISAQSPHQYLYNLFNKIVITEIKAYVVIQFSYAILEVHGQGYFSTESSLANEQIRYILQKLLQETIQVTGNLSRHYWKDDPIQYREGENYLEISRLLQGYVINEKILNNGKSCYGKCETYKELPFVKHYRYVNCHNDPFCRKQSPCGGKVHSCRSLSTIDMQICLAPTGTSRRYNYIEYKNHNALGAKSTCPTPPINVDAWIGWCPYCMCFCDEEGPCSDRYFSLKDVVSDVKNNKVVTGIRFAKKNKMIHLQVQQGEILPQ
ncbi:protein of unknown function (DUF4803) [Popillia japonica]|uniref:Secreted protein n=1 Tax=Popillia japonica TaxID=7064 RepID=A0AAW1MKI0_POPJA